ncbi:MAG: T9SS type A sorting domain-containing protein [Ignavibacteriota bacterium]
MKHIYNLFCITLIVFLSASISFGQWTQTNSPLTTRVKAMATSTIGATLAGGDQGLALTSDGGLSWFALNANVPNMRVACIATGGTTVFVGTDAGSSSGIVRSAAGGPWTEIGPGGGFPIFFSIVYTGSKLIAGSDGRIVISNDNGATWTNTPYGSLGFVNALATIGGNIISGTFFGADVSSDEFKTWKSSNAGLIDTNISCLKVDGTLLYAGTNGGVYLSLDNGSSWQALNNGMKGKTVTSIVVTGTTLFAATADNGVYYSLTHGADWQSANTGLTDLAVNAIAIAGTNLLAGTNGHGVWKRPLAEFGASGVSASTANAAEIQIYPNPATNSITIENDDANISEINIRNIVGQNIFERKVTSSGEITVDLSNFASGSYLLTLHTRTGITTGKFVKQ